MRVLRGVFALGFCGISAASSACKTPASPSEAGRDVLAMVGAYPIYVGDFEREFARVRVETDATLPSLLSQEAHRKALLNDLIDRRLILAEAEKSNVFVGLNEIEMAYEKARAGWAPDEFAAALRDRDTTAAEFKAQLRESLMIRLYLRDYVFSRVAVTDEEIDAYLDANPAFIDVPEKVRARQIVVKTQEQAKEIAVQLRGGLAFEDAAMKYSLSPDAASGGDLGWFARGDMPHAFDETCFQLTDGAVSQIVESPYGFHLFQLVEKRPAQKLSRDAAADKAEATMRADKEREARSKNLEQLRAATRIVIKEERLAGLHQ